MSENPRVAKLIEQLKTLKQQQKILESQVAALLEKLPPGSKERQDFAQLPEQMKIAIDKAYQELKALNLSAADLKSLE